VREAEHHRGEATHERSEEGDHLEHGAEDREEDGELEPDDAQPGVDQQPDQQRRDGEAAEPSQPRGADRHECVLDHGAASGRHQAQRATHERPGVDRHVEGRDQHHHDRCDHAHDPHPDRRERPEQLQRVVCVAAGQGVRPAGQLAALGAGDLPDLGERLLDDARDGVDELVHLAHEHGHEKRDHAGRRRERREEDERGAGASRDAVPLEPGRRGGERQGHEHRHEAQQHQRHELAEEEPRHNEGGAEDDRAVEGRRGDPRGRDRPVRRVIGGPAAHPLTRRG
jgi:hypothetical protein